MKPTSIVRYEFIQNLTNLVNGCNLPPFIIESVLKDMYVDIHTLSQRQLEFDLKNYTASLDDANKKSAD